MQTTLHPTVLQFCDRILVAFILFKPCYQTFLRCVTNNSVSLITKIQLESLDIMKRTH